MRFFVAAIILGAASACLPAGGGDDSDGKSLQETPVLRSL